MPPLQGSYPFVAVEPRPRSFLALPGLLHCRAFSPSLIPLLITPPSIQPGLLSRLTRAHSFVIFCPILGAGQPSSRRPSPMNPHPAKYQLRRQIVRFVGGDARLVMNPADRCTATLQASEIAEPTPATTLPPSAKLNRLPVITLHRSGNSERLPAVTLCHSENSECSPVVTLSHSENPECRPVATFPHSESSECQTGTFRNHLSKH